MQAKAPLITPVLIAGSLILMIGFAIRASFGVFQIPIAQEFGWARAEFSLAIAVQNLAWGIGQPLFGMVAEKFGDRLLLPFSPRLVVHHPSLEVMLNLAGPSLEDHASHKRDQGAADETAGNGFKHWSTSQPSLVFHSSSGLLQTL